MTVQSIICIIILMINYSLVAAERDLLMLHRGLERIKRHTSTRGWLDDRLDELEQAIANKKDVNKLKEAIRNSENALRNIARLTIEMASPTTSPVIPIYRARPDLQANDPRKELLDKMNEAEKELMIALLESHRVNLEKARARLAKKKTQKASNLLAQRIRQTKVDLPMGIEQDLLGKTPEEAAQILINKIDEVLNEIRTMR